MNDEYRLRVTDFISFSGLMNYGPRTGFYEEDKPNSNIGTSPPEVVGRMMVLAAEHVTMAGIVAYALMK